MKRFLTLTAAIISLFSTQAFGAEMLGDVVVTGAREAESVMETPLSVGIVKKDDITLVRPAQPGEIMGRVPGVWVSVTAGEGHITSIRQPLTTNPVYLFLEDGIPVRSTGFFNHNALYEINIPGADRIEVMKGPATALYGSDAIGGTINVSTRPAPLVPTLELTQELGEDGWIKTLASAGGTWGKNGIRIDYNRTFYDNWRERSGYGRQSVTLRWDRALAENSSLKTVLAVSEIDQDTGGTAALTKYDFEHRPWYNYQTFDFRKVKTARLSSAYERESEGGASLVSITPYLRLNRMELLPGWGIFKAGPNYYGYDSDTRFYSLGLLLKYRHDFKPLRTRLIVGADVDYSPGEYNEKRIVAIKSGDKYVGRYYSTSTANNYDYTATFFGVSPYAHVELSPIEKLRLTLGARYDALSYDYETRLAPNANRPDDASPSFSHLSPKAGLTYAFTPNVSGFLNYAHAFRVPSSGDLFRGSNGTASTAINLDPIKVNSYEAGLRAKAFNILRIDASAYIMKKTDDIVSYSPAPGISEKRNAGETTHKGVELALGVDPLKSLSLDLSLSLAKHRYDEYRVSSSIDYSDNEIALAPRTIFNMRANYRPAVLKGGAVEAEWVRIGKYWMNDANTERYNGHDIVNLRGSYQATKALEIYARVMNVFDELYAERAAKSGTSPAQYSPGSPRTFFAGLTYKWEKVN